MISGDEEKEPHTSPEPNSETEEPTISSRFNSTLHISNNHLDINAGSVSRFKSRNLWLGLKLPLLPFVKADVSLF